MHENYSHFVNLLLKKQIQTKQKQNNNKKQRQNKKKNPSGVSTAPLPPMAPPLRIMIT